MGSNNKNQLGIGDSENKYSPVLIETLIDLKIKDVNTVLLFVKIRMFIHGEIMSMGSVGNRMARLSNYHKI